MRIVDSLYASYKVYTICYQNVGSDIMAIPTRTNATRSEPKSQHVSEPIVQPFLQPDFDPAAYLNRSLPSLSTSTARQANGSAVPLADLSSHTQTLLSQLNAQTSRLSNTLTQLTDEIIRSGGRLAYEVEVLRGETTGLTDTLENGLKKDIEVFAPAKPVSTLEGYQTKDSAAADEIKAEDGTSGVADTVTSQSNEPEYLTNLRTLSLLRSRLDTVIQTFGQAMAWPVAPSEVASVTSSFISVSAPEASEENQSREEKAKAYSDKVRAEITDLLGPRSGNGTEGLEAATERVEELQELAELWKGTAEEKARMKFVEGLVQMLEDRQKALEGKTARKPGGGGEPARGVDMRYGNPDSSRAVSESGGGYGFLQKLRNDMYLD